MQKIGPEFTYFGPIHWA